MSNTGFKDDLLRDIESYTCGEVPSAIDLVRAPVLQDWTTEVRRVGKAFKLVVGGVVRKHPDFFDDERIWTSAVQWFDRKCRFVRTANRLYALGEPEGDEVPIEGIDA